MVALPFGGLKRYLRDVNFLGVIFPMFLQEAVGLPIVFSKAVSYNIFLWVEGL